LETLHNESGDWIISYWEKFGPIIEYLKRDYASDLYGSLEYIAGVLSKMQDDKDPTYRENYRNSILSPSSKVASAST